MSCVYVHLLAVAIVAILCGIGRCESLEDAWSIALAQNHRLAAAGLQEAAASQDVGAAVAERMPSVALRGGYTVRSDEPSFVIRDPLPGLGTFEFPYAERNAASAGAEMRVPLYTSGRIQNLILSAEARHLAAQHDAAQARLDLLLAVGEAYITVIRVERELHVAQDEFKSVEAITSKVTRLVGQERASECDLLAAQAAETAARQLCFEQTRSLNVARSRYNSLLGRSLSTPVTLEHVTLPKLTWSFDQLVQIGYEKRPDLLGLLAIANSHDFASFGARAEGLPQVTASVGAQYEENQYGSPQSLATGAVFVDWKIFDGRRAGMTANAEQIRASSIRHLVSDLKSQIALDILEAWNNAIQAAEQVDVANQRMSYATENLRITRLRFDCGTATITAVLEAQAQSSQATRDYHVALCEGVLAQLRIRHSAGIL
jgi:outer membrane protein TolC